MFYANALLKQKQDDNVSIIHPTTVSTNTRKYIVEKVITPNEALDLLSVSVGNRNIKKGNLDKLCQVIRDGEFDPDNGDTIKITVGGKLADGHHRLHSIIKTGIPTEVTLMYNVSDNAYDTLDSGRTRTHADMLKLNKFSHYNYMASCAKRYYCYLNQYHPFSGVECSPPFYVIKKICQEEHLLKEGVLDIPNAPKDINKPNYVCFYVVFHKKNPDKAKEFFNKLKGINIHSMQDPVLQLTKRCSDMLSLDTKIKMRSEVYCFIRAWNAFLEGKELSHFKIPDNYDFPKIKES